MQAICRVCGSSFDALRSSARYCGATCRKRASRAAKTAPVTRPPLHLVPPPPAEPAPEPTPIDPTVGPVERRICLQLGPDVDTVTGAQCVAIARRIDSGRDASGAAFASLNKELDRLVDKAITRQLDGDRSDPLNQLTAAVQLKLAAHG